MAQTVASFSLQALACGGAFRMPCASVQIRSGGDLYSAVSLQRKDAIVKPSLAGRVHTMEGPR